MAIQVFVFYQLLEPINVRLENEKVAYMPKQDRQLYDKVFTYTQQSNYHIDGCLCHRITVPLQSFDHFCSQVLTKSNNNHSWDKVVETRIQKQVIGARYKLNVMYSYNWIKLLK